MDEGFMQIDTEELMGQVSLLFKQNVADQVFYIYFQGPEVFQTSERWARPKVPTLDSKADRLTFQQVDIDYYMGKPMKGMPGAQSGIVPTMRIFGVTRNQNSLCCHVHGFAPYFYVTAPPQLQVSEQDLCFIEIIEVNVICYRPANVKPFKRR
jgi:hypothetical protein